MYVPLHAPFRSHQHGHDGHFRIRPQDARSPSLCSRDDEAISSRGRGEPLYLSTSPLAQTSETPRPHCFPLNTASPYCTQHSSSLVCRLGRTSTFPAHDQPSHPSFHSSGSCQVESDSLRLLVPRLS